jgi:hypothetical protein
MSKTESEVAGGVSVVIFIMWGIPSLGALYMVVYGMINNTYNGIYLIITCINVFILLIYGIASYLNEYHTENIPQIKIPQTENPQTEV